MHFEPIEQLVPGVPILYLNASSLKVTTCNRQYGMMVNGYKPLDEGDTKQRDIGSAMHKFAEQFTRHGDHAQAVLEASKAWPQVPRNTIVAAAARRQDVFIPPPLNIDGTMCVEIKFEVPWYIVSENQRPICQIVLCGTMDHLGHENGSIRLIDYKTTAYAQISYAFEKYKHETQFMFYMWVLYQFGHRLLPLWTVNDIRAGKFTSQVCVIQTSAKEPRWALGQKMEMNEYQYDLYENTLNDTLEARVSDYMLNHAAAPTGMLRNACIYCGFKSYCYAKSPHDARTALASFPIEEYNPLKER